MSGGIIIFLIAFISIPMIMLVIAKSTEKMNTKNNNAHDGGTSLEHNDCENVQTESCLHVYDVIDDKYNKVCKNCGHRNDKKAKRCTVCGKKLWF